MDGHPEPASLLPSSLMPKGHKQWQSKWSIFASQWTQPQLMKLADLALGEPCLHSSQIHGFRTGKLKEPGPKVLMVIGYVNLVIAAANKDEEAMATCPYTLPATASRLFFGKNWMKTPEGKALGPLEVFQAFCGILDLQCDGDLQVEESEMEAVSKAVGKFVRKKLINANIDFMDNDVVSKWNQPALMERLIYGKALTAAELIEHLDDISLEIGVEREEVIELAIKPAQAGDTK
jgi:hypothetical protein